jgi:hypothetical protein
VITGFFDPARGPHPYLTTAVSIPLVTGPQWASVTFMVDTGAAHTCIHPLDAIRSLGLQPAQLADPEGWPKTIQGRGVGGGVNYFEIPASYGLVNDDGSVEVIEGHVWIGQLTPGTQRMPSLIGWNLLRHFDLRIHGGRPSITLERI